MKALFLALSPHGFGETLIGLALADQLAPLGVTSQFIVEESGRTILAGRGHEFGVLEPGMGKLAGLIVDDVVQRFRPDLIILADYFTYCTISVRYQLDPWFIDGYGIPVVPIDIWEWGGTDFVVDIAGDHVYRASERFRSAPASLRPVPLAHLEPGDGGRAHPFLVAAGEEPLSARARSRLRSSLGVGEQDRLVLLATARWQVTGEAAYSQAASSVASGVPRMVTHYLEQLPERTHFLLIGEIPAAWSGLPAGRTHAAPPCSQQEFGAMLQAADAVLSLNIGGTTVWRAVMAGVPAMVLGNRYRLRDVADLDRADGVDGGFTEFVRDAVTEVLPLHPFRMWPLGFFSFLRPLLAGNPYADAVAQAEVLDERTVVNDLTGLLFDAGYRATRLAVQDSYASKVLALPPAGEVLAAVAGQLGLTAG
jgi:Family of unknown function (DUF6365)